MLRLNSTATKRNEPSSKMVLRDVWEIRCPSIRGAVQMDFLHRVLLSGLGIVEGSHDLMLSDGS